MLSADSPLYAGLSGITLSVPHFDLGEGVSLSRTYAHLFAPYMMAFSPPEAGKPCPRPWRAASAGAAFDVNVQLRIPENLEVEDGFDRFGMAWLFVALLRFRSAHAAICPVVSDTPFAEAAACEHEPSFVVIEADPRRPHPPPKPSILLENDLGWIAANWRAAVRLVSSSKPFNSLFQAFDQSPFVRDESLALLLLWGALETLFSPARLELRFRVSANIAAYLEASGVSRLQLQKDVAKLYDARSTAAHTAGASDRDALNQTYALVRRVIEKVISRNAVPTRDDLAGYLFGCGPADSD